MIPGPIHAALVNRLATTKAKRLLAANDVDGYRELRAKVAEVVGAEVLDAAAKAWDPARAFWANPPGVGVWGAANWQREVRGDDSQRILVRGGNKIGKTTTLSAAIADYFSGTHPAWRLPNGRPARILYVARDLENAYVDDVCRSLAEFLPEATWSDKTKYDDARGFTVSGKRQFRHRDGHTIIFRSGKQDQGAIMGIWADVVVVNEPPIRKLWGETMRAAGLKPPGSDMAGAIVLVGFTPVDESTAGKAAKVGTGSHGTQNDAVWLRDYINDPRRADQWSEHVIPLTPENAPHRSPQDIAQQIADMFPWEVGQRRDANWEGPAADRTLRGFDPTVNAFTLAPEGAWWERLPNVNPDAEINVGMVADHGEGSKKEHWILYAYQGALWPRSWILDEYVCDGATSVETDALALLDMLREWGLDPRQVDRWHGDTNSAGKSHLGKLNDLFAAAIQALCGFRPHIRGAVKGAGSVGLGTQLLNEAFHRQLASINTRATRTRRCIERWDGRTSSEFKDGVDAVRYGPGSLYKAEKKKVRRLAR